MIPNDDYIFYRLEAPYFVRVDGELPPGCSVVLWRPTSLPLMPRGVPLGAFWFAWWLMDRLHVFRSGDFSIVAIYEGDRLVHRTVAFPKYLRFPFMDDADLNLGETWTDPSMRGRGLAGIALRQAVTRLAAPGRAFWYVYKASNSASAGVIRKTGFKRVGVGRKVKRLGVNAIGFLSFTPQGNSRSVVDGGSHCRR
jgi:RimJ/RimL family protein N-acetyltransferase